jgi:hypothetical protein
MDMTNDDNLQRFLSSYNALVTSLVIAGSMISMSSPENFLGWAAKTVKHNLDHLRKAAKEPTIH